MKRIAATLALFGGLFFMSGISAADRAQVMQAIDKQVGLVRIGGSALIREDRIPSRLIIPLFYERRGCRGAWDIKALEELQRAIDNSCSEGLNPDDYHRRAIGEYASKLRSGSADAEMQAQFDIIATDALIRLAYHLSFGKADSEAFDSKFGAVQVLNAEDPVPFLEKALGSGKVALILSGLPPRNSFYLNLKKALERYQEIAAEGGWPLVPGGPALRLGVKEDRVAILRSRLAAVGDMEREDDADARVFDRNVEIAVKKFQRRHDLGADGLVGPATLRALQVPVERRIGQIRANLERARWLRHDIPPLFVMVDAAGFEVTVFRGEEPIWRSRVQVGRLHSRTPIFSSAIVRIVLNPAWIIPQGILEHDILPVVRREPTYLSSNNLRVIDHRGREVDPLGIDWREYTAEDFPYLVRQDPGPDNALGKVKFILPNKFNIYLHDTPRKELFERDIRTFSSGCIRVEHPLRLAELLLNDTRNWSMEKILAVVNSKRTRSLQLDTPVPVLLCYWTAQAQPDGRCRFKTDTYGRDDDLLEILDRGMEFDPPCSSAGMSAGNQGPP